MLKKLARKLKKPFVRLYWKLWYEVYSRRTTYGVQWYWHGEAARWKINQEIVDKTFFRKEKAEKLWQTIRSQVKEGEQEAALWRIERGVYKEMLESVGA